MQLKIIVNYIEAIREYNELIDKLGRRYSFHNGSSVYFGGLKTEDQEIYSNTLYNYEVCKKRLNRRVKQKLDK